MIANSTEENFQSKLEASSSTDHVKTSKASVSSSTPWLRLKDPRIVRVSRAFGGKDRHSKVCTVRGLRDRRVRLSVSTAVQLYDLQDRLGLNQPSKVVDWLLNAAKEEIDELPPLPIPSANIGLSYQSMLLNDHHSHEPPGIVYQTNEFKLSSNVTDPEASSHESNRSKLISISDNAFWRSKSKDQVSEKEIWADQRISEDQEKQGKNNNEKQKQVSANNSQPSFSALLNNVSPLGYQWEPSNFASAYHHMGSHGLVTSQAAEDVHNLNLMPLPLTTLPSPLSLSTGSQIFLCPPGLTQSLGIDPRQGNHLHMMSSSSQNVLLNNSLTPSLVNQSVRPFHFSMAPQFVSPEKNNGDGPNKNTEFASE